VSKVYFNHMAAVWDETATEKDEARLERMAARLNIGPGFRVLDVGTGTGVFIPFILDKIGVSGQIVALDLAAEMLRKARAKGFNGNIACLNADVTGLPLCDETFDSVVCYSSFPHFQDKPKALLEIKRVIKSGGSLYICHTSSRDSINENHRSIPAVAGDILPDEHEMRMMLLEAGFVDIMIEDDRESYLCYARKPG